MKWHNTLPISNCLIGHESQWNQQTVPLSSPEAIRRGIELKFTVPELTHISPCGGY
jgi:hypothetical protein